MEKKENRYLRTCHQGKREKLKLRCLVTMFKTEKQKFKAVLHNH